ncbi:septum formation initiator family protein [Clostridium nigeriense]|uniref:FtsB family cell division protein n=1 Tax=Clostridium nigeriense TaxID=1805470 RepID=UPI0027DCB55A|nr:septum formation initiator family protein [Clostridium nigeriense]
MNKIFIVFKIYYIIYLKRVRAIKKQLTLKRLIIVFIFAIFVVNYIKQEITMRRIQEDIVISQEQLQELKDKNSKLESDLKKANESNEYLEKLARERLGMIKEGEKVVNSEKQN